MMIKNIFFCMLLSLSVLGCKISNGTSDEEEYRKNDNQIADYVKNNNLSGLSRQTSGLWYQNLTTGPLVGDTTKPTVGSQISLRYQGRLLNGLSISGDSSAKASFPLSSSSLFYEPVLLMKRGQKARFIVPSYLAFGSSVVTINGVNVPSYSVIDFSTITLDSVRTEERVLQVYYISRQLPYTALPSTSGLHYTPLPGSAPSGNPISAGQSVTVSYKGILPLTGTVFEDNAGYTFIAGKGNVISGFDQGIALMRLGEKGLIGFPSALGYQSTAQGVIPPYSPLVFEVTVIAVK